MCLQPPSNPAYASLVAKLSRCFKITSTCASACSMVEILFHRGCLERQQFCRSYLIRGLVVISMYAARLCSPVGTPSKGCCDGENPAIRRATNVQCARCRRSGFSQGSFIRFFFLGSSAVSSGPVCLPQLLLVSQPLFPTGSVSFPKF